MEEKPSTFVPIIAAGDFGDETARVFRCPRPTPFSLAFRFSIYISTTHHAQFKRNRTRQDRRGMRHQDERIMSEVTPQTP